MKANEFVQCSQFPCSDMQQNSYVVPGIEIDPTTIKLVMISEASPANRQDYYYAGDNPLFAQTTVQAFNDAGIAVSSIADILRLGVYLTTAVKCGKTDYGIKSVVVEACSSLLEKELALFPEVKVLMLMGDVAIKSLKYHLPGAPAMAG